MQLLNKNPTSRPTAVAAGVILGQSLQPTAPETPPVASELLQSRFDLVRRGYERAQVDEYFALPPHRRPANPQFDLVRRGYHRDQVDEAVRLSGWTEPVPPGP
ncbi:hypothetical protein ACFC26_40900 [Kitasatospora purpeofusca]